MTALIMLFVAALFAVFIAAFVLRLANGRPDYLTVLAVAVGLVIASFLTQTWAVTGPYRFLIIGLAAGGAASVVYALRSRFTSGRRRGVDARARSRAGRSQR